MKIKVEKERERNGRPIKTLYGKIRRAFKASEDV